MLLSFITIIPPSVERTTKKPAVLFGWCAPPPSPCLLFDLKACAWFENSLMNKYRTSYKPTPLSRPTPNPNTHTYPPPPLPTPPPTPFVKTKNHATIAGVKSKVSAAMNSFAEAQPAAESCCSITSMKYPREELRVTVMSVIQPPRRTDGTIDARVPPPQQALSCVYRTGQAIWASITWWKYYVAPKRKN